MEKYKSLLEEARALADAAVGEDRGFTEEERVRIGNILEDAKKLKKDAELVNQLDDLDSEIELKSREEKDQIPKTLSEALLDSRAYRSWFSQVAPGGYIPESRKGLTSPPVDVKDFGILSKKDLITGLDRESAGVFVRPDDTGIYEPIGRFPTVLRNLVSVRRTTSDTVEFVRQTSQVTQAAPVPEANVADYTGYPGEVSGEKPRGSLSFERVTEVVKTLAVYVGATKRALSDAAQIRGIIDQELRESLVETLENQLLNGSGQGENFLGLANQPNTLLEPYDTDVFRTTRQAITSLAISGLTRPTAWVFHPADWQEMELLMDDMKRFYYAGPFALGPKRLWGIPVVESFYVAEGSAWLADWSKAVIWDREQATISVTDSHDDWFIRNMVAILAEMRAAFGIIRPTAFIEVELETGS